MVTDASKGAVWQGMNAVPESLADLEPRVRRILSQWGHDPTGLVQVLREVQEEFGCLPRPALALIARLLRIPYSRVTGVASFYSFLVVDPHGAYRVLFSDNITDRMAGSERLMEAMCHRLWVEPGKVSEDGLVSVGRTSCTGMCDQGPALLVNGRAIPALTSERVEQICELILARDAARRLARGAVRRAGPRASGGHPARPCAEARRRDPRGAAARMPAAGPSARPTNARGARPTSARRRARSRRSRRSSARTCAAAAARASRPASSGRRAGTRRASRATSSATPTRASPARSRTACCSRATPTSCSTA